VLTKISIFIL